jgi:hypothetical protein
MSEISNISVEKARLEPESVFKHPRDVVTEMGLTRGQKLATLARWRQHLLDKLRATDEGMPPPPGGTSADATMLIEVEKAEIDLQELANVGSN